MNDYFTISFIILCILIFWTIIIKNVNGNEYFESTEYNTKKNLILGPDTSKGHLMGRNIHTIIDNKGIVSESYNPPSAQGIYGCTQVPCLDGIPDNRTCWCCCNYH